MNDDFQQLRKNLLTEPSESSFKQIINQVVQWPNPNEQEIASTYANDHTQEWDDMVKEAKLETFWPSFPIGEPAPPLQLIRYLPLAYKKIGDKEVTTLMNSPYLREPLVLRLDGNQIGDEGAKAIADSSNMTSLQFLILDNNTIGPIGAQAIASSPHLQNLRMLHLEGNQIGQTGAFHLGLSPYLSSNVKRFWLGTINKQILYQRATEMKVLGRSKMNKNQLIEALLSL